MRRSHLIALLACALAVEGSGSVLARRAAPAETRFDIRAFGAAGDGKALDTDAINRAIDRAAAAGSPSRASTAVRSKTSPSTT